MPRIRRKRDRDWEPSDEDFPEAHAQTTDDEPSDASRPYEGYEGDSGRSWLSNAVILGSLPDNKLKAALARYRAMVRLCEGELALRASPTSKRHASRVRRIDLDDAEITQPRKKVARTRRKAAANALTHEQLLQALQMLSKLKQTQEKKDAR